VSHVSVSPRSGPRSFVALVVAVTIALVAALALALLLWRPSAALPPREGQGAPADVTDQVASMRREMQLLRRQVQVMAHQQGQAKPAAASPVSAAPPPPPLTQEEVSERDRKRFEGLARKLAAEPVDRPWAAASERLIADTIRKPAFKGSKLLEATCRSTLCRFEVSHDNDTARARFSSTLPTRLPSMPSGSMRNAEGPERKTIVYVAREGHRVPRDEPQ
jgi:hypothetical protein